MIRISKNELNSIEEYFSIINTEFVNFSAFGLFGVDVCDKTQLFLKWDEPKENIEDFSVSLKDLMNIAKFIDKELIINEDKTYCINDENVINKLILSDTKIDCSDYKINYDEFTKIEFSKNDIAKINKSTNLIDKFNKISITENNIGTNNNQRFKYCAKMDYNGSLNLYERAIKTFKFFENSNIYHNSKYLVIENDKCIIKVLNNIDEVYNINSKQDFVDKMNAFIKNSDKTTIDKASLINAMDYIKCYVNNNNEYIDLIIDNDFLTIGVDNKKKLVHVKSTNQIKTKISYFNLSLALKYIDSDTFDFYCNDKIVILKINDDEKILFNVVNC